MKFESVLVLEKWSMITHAKHGCYEQSWYKYGSATYIFNQIKPTAKATFSTINLFEFTLLSKKCHPWLSPAAAAASHHSRHLVTSSQFGFQQFYLQ